MLKTFERKGIFHPRRDLEKKRCFSPDKNNRTTPENIYNNFQKKIIRKYYY